MPRNRPSRGQSVALALHRGQRVPTCVAIWLKPLSQIIYPLYYGNMADGIYLTPGDFKLQVPHKVNEQCSLGVIAMPCVVYKHSILVHGRILSDSARTFNASWEQIDKSMLLEGY